MTNKLIKPYTNIQYAEFVKIANDLGKRIEETDAAVYMLAENEILQNGEIVDISDTPEYKQKEAKKREFEFLSNFIETEFGFFRKRPKGYSNAVQSIDVINNMVSLSKGVTEQIASIVIFYPKPDFTKPEQCTEDWLVAHQGTLPILTLEDWIKFYIKFQTDWAMEEYRMAQVKAELEAE